MWNRLKKCYSCPVRIMLQYMAEKYMYIEITRPWSAASFCTGWVTHCLFQVTTQHYWAVKPWKRILILILSYALKKNTKIPFYIALIIFYQLTKKDFYFIDSDMLHQESSWSVLPRSNFDLGCNADFWSVSNSNMSAKITNAEQKHFFLHKFGPKFHLKALVFLVQV